MQRSWRGCPTETYRCHCSTTSSIHHGRRTNDPQTPTRTSGGNIAAGSEKNETSCSGAENHLIHVSTPPTYHVIDPTGRARLSTRPLAPWSTLHHHLMQVTSSLRSIQGHRDGCCRSLRCWVQRERSAVRMMVGSSFYSTLPVRAGHWPYTRRLYSRLTLHPLQ
jgi:hypothetical protein